MAKSKTGTLVRDAKTGRIVKPQEATRRPATTVKETFKRK